MARKPKNQDVADGTEPEADVEATLVTVLQDARFQLNGVMVTLAKGQTVAAASDLLEALRDAGISHETA